MLKDDFLKQNASPEPHYSLSTTNDTLLESHKILPIPIIRRSLPNSQDLRAKLRANGYKTFSKVSASGPDTLQILQNIQKSQSLKFTTKFEFDPYLCDFSCLKELNLALKKLKNIKHLRIIFRRLGGPEESGRVKAICPNIYKLARLRKAEVEFMSMENLKESHIFNIHHALQRCYLLKSFKWLLVESPIKTIEYFKSIIKLFGRLKKIEHLSDYIIIKKAIPFSDIAEVQGSFNLPKMPSIKHLELTYLLSKEWANIGEDGDLGTKLLTTYIANHTNLERFTSRYIRSSFLYQDILSFMQSFTALTRFRHLDFELLNCEIGDTELAAFAYGLSRLPQLRYVCFKVIQSAPLSMDYIEKLIEKISQMENLEKFDFYFRKHHLPAREVSRLQKLFSQFKDVQCSFSRQSLHLFKDNSSN